MRMAAAQFRDLSALSSFSKAKAVSIDFMRRLTASAIA
jgi:hypothetical protein